MAAWTYSDWITKEDGSAERLSRLRLHIQEVSDALKAGGGGKYAINGRELDVHILQAELDSLREIESRESQRTTGTTTNRVGWTRGRAIT